MSEFRATYDCVNELNKLRKNIDDDWINKLTQSMSNELAGLIDKQITDNIIDNWHKCDNKKSAELYGETIETSK